MTLSAAPFNSSCICDVEYLEDDHEEARLAVQMPFSLSIFVFCVLIRGGCCGRKIPNIWPLHDNILTSFLVHARMCVCVYGNLPPM